MRHQCLDRHIATALLDSLNGKSLISLHILHELKFCIRHLANFQRLDPVLVNNAADFNLRHPREGPSMAPSLRTFKPL